MKDEECVYYLDSSKCDSDDCHGCVARLKENKRKYHDKEIRAKAIEDAIEASAKAICIGCGHLDGHSCTYNGSNCGVSKPMLGVVVKALEKLKGE